MEADKRICKMCNLLKDRILIGKYPDNKNKKYSDDLGKLWNGSVCGSCNVSRSHKNMKSLRERK